MNYSSELQEAAVDCKPSVPSEDPTEVTMGKSIACVVDSHRPDSRGMACSSSTAESSSRAVTTIVERGPLVAWSGPQVKKVQSLSDKDIETVATEIDPTPTPPTDHIPTLATDPTPIPPTDPTPTPTTDPTPTPVTDPTLTPATDPTPSISSVDPAPTWTIDPTCTECAVRRPDPDSKDLVMYLHAVSYKVRMVHDLWVSRMYTCTQTHTQTHVHPHTQTHKDSCTHARTHTHTHTHMNVVLLQGPNWEYRTDLPYWASEDFHE